MKKRSSFSSWAAKASGAGTKRAQRAPRRAIDFLANNGEIGGAEVMLLRMAQVAAEQGVEVRVVGPQEPAMLAEACDELGLTYHAIPARDRRQYLINLAKWSLHRQPNLLWCNGLLPAVACSLSINPRIVHLHQFPKRKHQLALMLARMGAERTIVASRYMSTQVPKTYPLENWTEDPRSADLNHHKIAIVRVGYIGRIAPIKGIDVLAEAMSQLENSDGDHFTLTIAGEGRFVPGVEVAKLREQLHKLRNITELGWIDRDAFFRNIDIVVVPSTRDEAFGLVAAEAMSFGVPVIVSDVGALREVVGSEHPWIVTRGDATDLAVTIRRVSQTRSAAVDEVCERARIRWSNKFSSEVGGRRFVELLRALNVAVAAPMSQPTEAGSRSA